MPGPGYYNWDQYFSKNKEKKKPGIEFKFVYGHPSWYFLSNIIIIYIIIENEFNFHPGGFGEKIEGILNNRR